MKNLTVKNARGSSTPRAVHMLLSLKVGEEHKGHLQKAFVRPVCPLIWAKLHSRLYAIDLWELREDLHLNVYIEKDDA